MKFSSPTLRLLTSSTPVGLSGALRVYTSFLLVGISPHLPSCIAAGLVIYATYTLDRCLAGTEDAINQRSLAGADRHVATLCCGLTFTLGLGLFFQEGLFVVPFIPLFIGILYSRGITVGSFPLKLKGSAGGKNAVIGLTWGGSIAFVISHWTANPLLPLCIFFFYGLKLFINSILYDIKDLAGDLAAGIATIPALLGEARTRYLLTSLSLVLHAGMAAFVLLGLIRPELAILGYSLFVGVPFILCYTSNLETQASWIRRHLREIAIDGEAAGALALRSLTGLVPGAIVPGYG